MIYGQFCAARGSTIDFRRRPPDYLARPCIGRDRRGTRALRPFGQGGSMLSEKTAGLILSQREARSTQAGSGFVSSANAFLILNTPPEGRLEVVSAGRDYGRNRAPDSRSDHSPRPGLVTGGRLFRNSACCRAACRCRSSSFARSSGLGPVDAQPNRRTIPDPKSTNVASFFIQGVKP